MTTMQEEEKTCSMQFKKCKCQRAVLLSAYEGLGIVVVFMLYSSQKKKSMLNITMFSLLDKSKQHELIHIYLKD